MKIIRFTKEGYEKLKKEHAELLASRPAAVLDLKTAREMGDLSENGYYKASRAKLSFIDSRLERTSQELKHAILIAETHGDTVGVGSTVVLSDGKKESTYHIVGDLEASPLEGKISLLSPLGSSIAGHKKGDAITITTPAREITYKVMSVT